MASCSIDRWTRKPIYDWQSVLQAVDTIFETEIGDRLMLRYFGGGVRRMLGRKLTPDVLALATALFYLAVAAWEPRLRVVKVSVAPSAEEIRQGEVSFVMEAVYRPRGHLGDPTEEVAYIGVGINDAGNFATMPLATEAASS